MPPLPPELQKPPIPAPVRAVLERLTAQGYRAFLVGGCVRDMLRGQTPKDFDVATSARPEQVQACFRKVIPTGIAHGTVTVLSNNVPVEVTTFRTEGAYVDGRRPSTVEFREDIADDLSRRDFTINAMAFNPIAFELVDPFGGQVDLRAGIIRCVGRALDRFSEDGLRALRAVRFSSVLGFSVEADTLAAIPKTLPIFAKVARERMRDELTKLLLSARASPGLELLQQTGLLGVFLPQLSAEGFSTVTRAVDLAPALLEERLAALLHRLTLPELTSALAQLKLPSKATALVTLMVRNHALAGLGTESDSRLRRFSASIGIANVPRVLAAAEAIARARSVDLSTVRARLEAIVAQNPPLTAGSLALSGNDIMLTLAVGPSRVVGEATAFLLDQVLEDPALNSGPTLTHLLRQWAQGRGP